MYFCSKGWAMEEDINNFQAIACTTRAIIRSVRFGLHEDRHKRNNVIPKKQHQLAFKWFFSIPYSYALSIFLHAGNCYYGFVVISPLLLGISVLLGAAWLWIHSANIGTFANIYNSLKCLLL